MRNLQIQVEAEESEKLDQLAGDTKSSRSEVPRSAVREGVQARFGEIGE